MAYRAHRVPGVVVAVIDTGIDYTHPDLRGSMWVNPHEIPGNGIDEDGNGIVDEAPKSKHGWAWDVFGKFQKLRLRKLTWLSSKAHHFLVLATIFFLNFHLESFAGR